MKHTNDNLSRACSAMLKSAQADCDMANDLGMFHAPSECYADVFRSNERKLVAALNALGFADEDAVHDALAERGVPFHSTYRG